MTATIEISTYGNESKLIIKRGRGAFLCTATFPTTRLNKMLRAWIVKLSNLDYDVIVKD